MAHLWNDFLLFQSVDIPDVDSGKDSDVCGRKATRYFTQHFVSCNLPSRPFQALKSQLDANIARSELDLDKAQRCLQCLKWSINITLSDKEVDNRRGEMPHVSVLWRLLWLSLTRPGL